MKKSKGIIAFLLLFFWMSVIFIMSAQPADKSSQMSGGIVSKLIAALFNEYDVQEQMVIKGVLTVIVRKTAHFLEYFILGLLAFCSISTFKNYNYKKITCIFFGVAYAIGDEVHQYFVPGRACRLIDVLIDTAGVVTSMIFIFVILNRKKRKSGELNAKKETD